MITNQVVLNPQLHRALKFRPTSEIGEAWHTHLFPVALDEFPQLACEYPLVFVKNSETGQFQAVALTGFQPGQNLYWQGNRWQARQLPQSVLAYPWSLVVMAGQLQLAISDAAACLHPHDGLPLYVDHAVEAPWLQQRRHALVRQAQQLQLLREWTQRLVALDLLQAQILQFADGQQINGLYLISQEKLQQLRPDQLQQLTQQGDMLLIMAQVISLQHIDTLVQKAQSVSMSDD